MSKSNNSALDELVTMANAEDDSSKVVFTTKEEAKKGPKVVSTFSSQKKDPAVENKAVRDKIEEPVNTGTLKCVARPRVFGTQNSGGSHLAKSTLRLGLDTKNVSQIKFEKGLTIDKDVKSKVKSISMSVTQGMGIFEQFEKVYGGKATEPFKEKRDAYQKAKSETLKELGISTNSKGQPIWSDDNQSQAYFHKLKDKSFSYWEIYMSYKPDNVRATQTRKVKLLDLSEAEHWFNPVIREGWID